MLLMFCCKNKGNKKGRVPSEELGLNLYVGQKFLADTNKILCKLFGVTPVVEFKTIRVEVELHNIDILILTDEGTTDATCWVIENKVKSSQHSNQLDKYVRIVNGENVNKGRNSRVVKDYKNFVKHFCFLTLVNESAKSSKVEWKNTTYKEFSQLLRAC